ncbi:MAG: PolC-type DNA polymerase III [Ruminococcaceae bacterium]|nr:PolC-type DNA polymerase III [Oscillospiraceae bacterium]
MIENNDKRFFDFFKRYKTDDKTRQMLESGTNVRVRLSKDPLRIEVYITFPMVLRNRTLHAVERELCAYCEAESVRIFPTYPSSLFDVSFMEDVVEEAVRSGVIVKGYFDEAVYEDDGETVRAVLPFVDTALSFMSSSGTCEVLERILSLRFSIERRVLVVASRDAEERTRQRLEKNAEILREADRQALEEMRAAMRARAEAEEEEKDPHADFTRVSSLMGGETTVALDEEGLVRIGNMCFDTEGSEAILGEAFSLDRIKPMSDVNEPRGTHVFFGEVFSVETKEKNDGARIQATVGIHDGSSSLYIKKTSEAEEAGWISALKAGKCIAVKGTLYADRFDGETLISPKAIMTLKKRMRKDTAEEKRVELHLHTVMSTMDAVIHPAELVNTAISWGHKAIAVTDHGTVQAFPEVMLAVEKAKSDLKVIYGIEAYYVNDEAPTVGGFANTDYGQPTVVFDLETTGLSAANCQIIEFGAVKLINGEIVDRFSSFSNPGVPIPEKITELTSITDEMVKDAPPVDTVLKDFLAFVGDSLLVAHNAKFDTGFLRAAAERSGVAFENPWLDTVAISQYVNPDLKKHTLDAIAKHYRLDDFHHHRAVDDAETLAAIFIEMLARLSKEGIGDYTILGEKMGEGSDPLKLRTHHAIILAQNATGLKNLYTLISGSYLTYFRRFPRIPRTEIEKHREGLLIGSACEAGELYQAILDNRSEEDIEKIASFYDYLEIQPLCNNMFMVGENSAVSSVEDLKRINRRIIDLGKKLGKPTVATCDAHFLEKDDEIYRKILLAGMKFKDADKDTGIYLRTTDEMLAEFSYLGDELAREVVIENPNKIADSIERLRPIPEGTYTPSLPGAEEELQQRCWDRAMDWYGYEGTIPEIVSGRLKKELDSIIKHGFAVLYMIAQKLVAFSEQNGYLVGSRGSVGSSFVAIMSGISEVNPLPPHYRCPACRYNEFITDGSYGSGFDLPDKKCPHCDTLMYADGQDIPFETFLGFHGDKSPDIDLNFSGDVQGKVHKYTEDLFGEGHVFRAGTLGTLASKTAYGFVAKYLEDRKLTLPKAEMFHIISRCIGVKRTTGQHPGGIIVVPREYDIHDFSPVQHPADDPNSSIITTHFPFEFLHDTILKLDELGHDMPTKYKMLERYTDTSVLDVKMNDASIYELFASTAPLGVTSEALGCPVGTYGLPEMGTRFIQQVLVDAKPKNFADLMQISGLTHGTNVWLGNAQDLIKDGVCDISQVVGTRDGIMLYLIRHELDNSMAFKIMEDVRKGRGLKPEYEEAMLAHGVPEWYIASCKKIKYMFPKAHAAAYVMSAIRLGWYKIYYPMEFYAAFLSVAPGGFDAQIVMGGIPKIESTLKEIEEKGNEATQKEAEQVTTLLLVKESLLRGVKYLPVDLYKSDAKYFLPEDGKIRMPFSSIGGLGETAANKIVQIREEGEIFSVEELRTRGGLSKPIIELLRSCGALDGLSETNQLSFF